MKNLRWYVFAQFVLVLHVTHAVSAQIVFTFPKDGSGGSSPTGGLISDAAGNLYGTTASGGAHQQGAVYKLSFVNGAWTEEVLYSFKGGADDGADPESALLLEATGDLYGTTAGGGPSNDGTVFKLSPDGTGGVDRNPYSTFSKARTEVCRIWLLWSPMRRATRTESPRDTVIEGPAPMARSLR
jgi:uncharacterized repeat protein (TIGR03803 family)